MPNLYTLIGSGMDEKQCTLCGISRALSEYQKDASRRDGLRAWCNDCRAARSREYYAANKERYRANGVKWRQENPGRAREISLQSRRAARTAVFDHYGTCCACCGSTENLTIDHSAGQGGEHRQRVMGNPAQAGWPFYYWLIRNGFPQGYQTLCDPCNKSKQNRGRCQRVHKTKDPN